MTNLLIKKDKKTKRDAISSRESGFTLVELAIVILIGGILMSFMGAALMAYMKKNQISKTQFRIEKIKEAMGDYLNVNGHYPCAASRFLGSGDADFGRQVTTTCNAGAFAGTARNANVRIGAVPTRTLNLPDEFIADSWGHKFTYAVTEVLATPTLYQADGGAITIEDGAGNSLVNPVDTAHYVVTSHGQTGDGSYPLGAATLPSVPCPTAANAMDDENCDNDNSFIATLVNSDTASTNFFDDYALFKGQTAPVFAIPTGAVMAFNLAACPDEWSEFEDENYNPADPDHDVQFPARGRFLIGSQAAVKQMPEFLEQISNPLEQVDFNISLVGVSSDGDPEAAIPPYVALLYCQKD